MRAFEAMNPAAVTVTLMLIVCITIFCLEPMLLAVSLLSAIAFFVMRNGRSRAGFHIAALGMPLLFALLNPLWNQHPPPQDDKVNPNRATTKMLNLKTELIFLISFKFILFQ